jgi:hypothetical protein
MIVAMSIAAAARLSSWRSDRIACLIFWREISIP